MGLLIFLLPVLSLIYGMGGLPWALVAAVPLSVAAGVAFYLLVIRTAQSQSER